MTDQEFIDYCEKRTNSLNCQFEGRAFTRMFALAGKPRAYAAVEQLVPRKMYSMRDEMEALVHLAFRRATRPAGGLKIQPGRAYRDVNGDVRHVFEVIKSFDKPLVVWDMTPKRGPSCRTAPLQDFQEWALEEIQR